MACLAGCLVASLSVVFLAVVSLPSRGEAMGGLPQPPPDVNFTVGVEGTVWCKSCRYAGYVRSMDASPLPNAAALLQCQRDDDDGRVFTVWNTTDARGYFLMHADWQSAAFKSKDCRVKVYVPWSSTARGCTVAVEPNPEGAPLKFRRFVPLSGEMQARYSAGDFTFAPENPDKC